MQGTPEILIELQGLATCDGKRSVTVASKFEAHRVSCIRATLLFCFQDGVSTMQLSVFVSWDSERPRAEDLTERGTNQGMKPEASCTIPRQVGYKRLWALSAPEDERPTSWESHQV